MTKQELIEKLQECAKSNDTEHAHISADALLLSYIRDPEVTAAYDAIFKWYA